MRFILQPIHNIYQAISANNRSEIDNIISRLKFHLEDYEKEKSGDALLRKIMGKCCSIPNSILPFVISHFPSPIVAQTYRFDVIFKGRDPELIDAVKNVRENGKFVMQIPKTLGTNDRGRRYAFGRILSGKLNKGDKIRVIADQGTYPNKVFSIDERKTVRYTQVIMLLKCYCRKSKR